MVLRKVLVVCTLVALAVWLAQRPEAIAWLTGSAAVSAGAVGAVVRATDACFYRLFEKR